MVREKKAWWEERVLKPVLARFNLEESPSRFYTPADITES